MSTTKKYRIFGFLRTLSPMHITSPESARLNLAEMKPFYGDSKEHPPLNLTQKLSVMDPGSGGTRQVPVIAANNIMGRLRRHAADQVIQVLKAKGQRISIGTYSALMCGAVTGNPDGADVTFSEYRKARAHPYVGLLGGGPRMMRRHVRFFNAVPYNDLTAPMFSRTKHPNFDETIHSSPNDTRKLTQCWIMNRNDDLRELVNISQAESVIEDFTSKVTARQQAIVAASTTKAEGDPRLSTRSFSAFEFVVPGVYFPLCFELDVTDAQMGLFLASLDSFCATERIGGHARNGLGLFSLTDVVVTDDAGVLMGTNLFNNSRLVKENSFAAPYLQAWASAAQDIEADELEALFAPPAEAQPVKAKRTKEDIPEAA